LKAFKSSSGRLKNYKQIATLVCPYLWFEDGIQKGIKDLYKYYMVLFNYAVKMNWKSLALIPMGTMEELEMSLCALARSLNDFFTEDRAIKEVTICSIERDILEYLKTYFDNGIDQSVFNSLIGETNDDYAERMTNNKRPEFNDRTPENSNQRQALYPALNCVENNQNQDNIPINQNKINNRQEIDQQLEVPKFKSNKSDSTSSDICFKCKSSDSNRFLDVFLNLSYLKTCKNNGTRKCESCLILFDVAQIIDQHFERLQNKRVQKFCLRCSIYHILKIKKVA